MSNSWRTTPKTSWLYKLHSFPDEFDRRECLYVGITSKKGHFLVDGSFWLPRWDGHATPGTRDSKVWWPEVDIDACEVIYLGIMLRQEAEAVELTHIQSDPIPKHNKQNALPPLEEEGIPTAWVLIAAALVFLCLAFLVF